MAHVLMNDGGCVDADDACAAGWDWRRTLRALDRVALGAQTTERAAVADAPRWSGWSGIPAAAGGSPAS